MHQSKSTISIFKNKEIFNFKIGHLKEKASTYCKQSLIRCRELDPRLKIRRGKHRMAASFPASLESFCEHRT
jgi:hypothetical protein